MLGADGENIVEDGLAAMGDRGELENVRGLGRRVVEPIIPERAVVCLQVRADAPFEDNLGIGGDEDIHRFGGDDLHGLAE